MRLKDTKINIVPNIKELGPCRIQGKKQRCGKAAKYLIFGDDGAPKSSRLDSACCEKHLPKAIKLCHKYNIEKYSDE